MTDRYAHRKGKVKIQLQDAQGKAMAGRKVKLELKKHAFKFGCNIFWLNEMLTRTDGKILGGLGRRI